ncbi:TRAP transporter small permease [Azospirillum sp. RWY-5-1]|uniref:TRAP transporter small permease protein n=1 Tax=Azospirillum oleiclasticum TaxID=2735135 RepID=A0ABX2TA01_9PROT|nr:TRAP transporter small permease [Azospirillum oleiclasticum]NYZ20994.1 TRAP transporter small permease [Azospirillum oleiclasticum]
MAACLAAMVVLVFSNVVMRYLFGTGIAEGEELARLCFVWLIFIGATLAVREHGHIGVDMVVRRMSPAVRRVCLLVNHALVLWALWMLGEGSWTMTMIGLDSVLPVTGISTAVFGAAGVFLAVTMSLILIADVWAVLSGRAGTLVDVSASAGHGE